MLLNICFSFQYVYFASFDTVSKLQFFLTSIDEYLVLSIRKINYTYNCNNIIHYNEYLMILFLIYVCLIFNVSANQSYLTKRAGCVFFSIYAYCRNFSIMTYLTIFLKHLIKVQYICWERFSFSQYQNSKCFVFCDLPLYS